MEPTGERGFDARGCRDNPPWLSFCRMVTFWTGTEACPYNKRKISRKDFSTAPMKEELHSRLARGVRLPSSLDTARKRGRAATGASDRSRPRTGAGACLLRKQSHPPESEHAIPRICRTPGKPALRYRARRAGKPDSPSGSSPVPHWIESIRKNGRFSHGHE